MQEMYVKDQKISCFTYLNKQDNSNIPTLMNLKRKTNFWY